MSHFAHVNSDGVVDRVIVAEQDFIDSGAVGTPSEWVQTSYNTYAGEHTDPVTKIKSKAKALRKNYAGIGYVYDKQRDAFIPPRPDEQHILDEETCLWVLPVQQEGESV